MPYIDETKKVHSLSIVILTINMERLNSNHFLVVNLNFVEDLSMITSEFIMNCDIEGDIDYTLRADLEYPVNIQPLHRDLPFLPKKREINGKIKLICTLNSK